MRWVPAQWVPWPLPSDRLRSGIVFPQERDPELQVVNVDTRVDEHTHQRLPHHHRYTHTGEGVQVSLGR